ncbi:BON domain-containing protein [Devosia sp.]|uniref:BON domain-containing protein n=1 Tax=Devosia sp. TaxID=1871048 RepID=UPI003264ABA6
MLNDSELKKSVLAELNWEPSVIAAHIGVEANSGIVTLTGHVDNYAGKYAAEAAAGRVRGVKAIVEKLEVKLPGHLKVGDEAIAAAALERFSWSVSIPSDMIKVKVEKGWVTLSGEVDWHFQKEAAVRDVRELSGVVGVSDLVTIKPRVDVETIGHDITHALHRSWYDPKTITVRADGGKISLSGTVHSWHDREEAELTAWAAPGATAVENHIAIV